MEFLHRIIDIFTGFNVLSVTVRLLLALIMGGLIGMERGRHGRAAGMRTHILVCVGSCMTALVGIYIMSINPGENITRIAAQVISGIGFLGAGTIVVTKHNQIKGLTTAAGLWACAAVGLSLGIGFYEAALVSGIAVYVVLTLLHRWDDRMRMKGKVFDVYFELSKGYPLGDFIRAVRDMNLEISGIRMEADAVLRDGSSAFTATIKAKRRVDHASILAQINKLDGVDYLEEI